MAAAVARPGRFRWRRGGVLAVAGWTLFWLLLVDLGAGQLFRGTGDQRRPPGGLVRYFEYGRSVEGKLRAMVHAQDEKTALIARAGWLRRDDLPTDRARPTAPDHALIAFYGQSFTLHLVQAMAALEPRFEHRYLGGPAAPLGHAYKRYQIDRGRHQASVVVLGVLASALPGLMTLTPMTAYFEAPAPYTYPRYRLEGGQLRELPAPIEDLAGLRRTLAEPMAWAAFRGTLAASDAAFSALVFDSDPLDHSVLGRLIRRAIGIRHQHDFLARYHDVQGFRNQDGLLDIARALLLDFGRSARADGAQPLVLLIDDRGHPGHLEAAVGETLRAAAIPSFSTHALAPASHLSSFQPDGHFTREVNQRLSRVLLDRLRAMAPALRGQPH